MDEGTEGTGGAVRDMDLERCLDVDAAEAEKIAAPLLTALVAEGV